MKLRKIKTMCAAALLAFSLQAVVPLMQAGAEDIPLLNDYVDMDKVTADAWQNDEAGGNVHPPLDAFGTTSISTDSGIDAADIKRFSASVDVNYAHHEGAPTVIDGVATNSLIIPFKEEVNLFEVRLTFSICARRYMFNLYTSMDGETWTPVTLSAGAQQVKLLTAYDDQCQKADISGKNLQVWASDPTGSSVQFDKPAVLTFSAAVKTKYLKMTFYGNDAAQGIDKIENQWNSFNNLQLLGDLVKEDEGGNEGGEDTNPTTAPTESTKPAPATGDHSPMILITLLAVSGVMTAACLVLFRKEKV